MSLFDEEVFDDPLAKTKRDASSDPYFDDVTVDPPPKRPAQPAQPAAPLSAGPGEEPFHPTPADPGGPYGSDSFESLGSFSSTPAMSPKSNAFYQDWADFKDHYGRVTTDLTDLTARNTASSERLDHFFDNKVADAYSSMFGGDTQTQSTTKDKRHLLVDDLSRQLDDYESRIAEGDSAWFGEDEAYEEAKAFASPENTKYIRGLKGEHDRLVAESKDYEEREYRKRQEKDALLAWKLSIPHAVREAGDEWEREQKAMANRKPPSMKKVNEALDSIGFETDPDYEFGYVLNIDQLDPRVSLDERATDAAVAAQSARFQQSKTGLMDDLIAKRTGEYAENDALRKSGFIAPSWKGIYNGHPLGITASERELLDVDKLKKLGLTAYNGKPIDEALSELGGEEKIISLRAASSALKAHNAASEAAIKYFAAVGTPEGKNLKAAWEILDKAADQAVGNAFALGFARDTARRGESGGWWERMGNAMKNGWDDNGQLAVFDELLESGEIDETMARKLASAFNDGDVHDEKLQKFVEELNGKKGWFKTIGHAIENYEELAIVGAQSMSMMFSQGTYQAQKALPYIAGIGAAATFFFLKNPRLAQMVFKGLSKISVGGIVPKSALGAGAGASLSAAQEAFFFSSMALEQNGVIMEELMGLGVDIHNPREILAAWNNESIREKIKDKGQKRGIPIYLMDRVGAFMLTKGAGFLTSSMRKSAYGGGRAFKLATGTAATGAGYLAADAAAGATGEYLAQVMANEPGEAIRKGDIVLEGMAEFTGPQSVLKGGMSLGRALLPTKPSPTASDPGVREVTPAEPHPASPGALRQTITVDGQSKDAYRIRDVSGFQAIRSDMESAGHAFEENEWKAIDTFAERVIFNNLHSTANSDNIYFVLDESTDVAAPAMFTQDGEKIIFTIRPNVVAGGKFGLAESFIHEGNHFAEEFILEEGVLENAWNSLSDTQKNNARLEYATVGRAGGQALSAAELTEVEREVYNNLGSNEKLARSEWLSLQISRVLRGELTKEGMSSTKEGAALWRGIQDIIEIFRDVVAQLFGAEDLSPKNKEEFDAYILSKLLASPGEGGTAPVTPAAPAPVETTPAPAEAKGTPLTPEALGQIEKFVKKGVPDEKILKHAAAYDQAEVKEAIKKFKAEEEVTEDKFGAASDTSKLEPGDPHPDFDGVELLERNSETGKPIWTPSEGFRWVDNQDLNSLKTEPATEEVKTETPEAEPELPEGWSKVSPPSNPDMVYYFPTAEGAKGNLQSEFPTAPYKPKAKKPKVKVVKATDPEKEKEPEGPKVKPHVSGASRKNPVNKPLTKGARHTIGIQVRKGIDDEKILQNAKHFNQDAVKEAIAEAKEAYKNRKKRVAPNPQNIPVPTDADGSENPDILNRIAEFGAIKTQGKGDYYNQLKNALDTGAATALRGGVTGIEPDVVASGLNMSVDELIAEINEAVAAREETRARGGVSKQEEYEAKVIAEEQEKFAEEEKAKAEAAKPKVEKPKVKVEAPSTVPWETRPADTEIMDNMADGTKKPTGKTVGEDFRGTGLVLHAFTDDNKKLQGWIKDGTLDGDFGRRIKSWVHGYQASLLKGTKPAEAEKALVENILQSLAHKSARLDPTDKYISETMDKGVFFTAEDLRALLVKYDLTAKVEAPKPKVEVSEGTVVTDGTYSGEVTELAPHQVFVFGSNPEGRHGKGSALKARQWGAELGNGKGPQGQTYAIPTKDLRVKKDKGFKSISEKDIIDSLIEFYEYAESNPDNQFLVADWSGKNLNGYSGEEMASMFAEVFAITGQLPPGNVVFSKNFYSLLEDTMEIVTNRDIDAFDGPKSEIVEPAAEPNVDSEGASIKVGDLVEHIDDASIRFKITKFDYDDLNDTHYAYGDDPKSPGAMETEKLVLVPTVSEPIYGESIHDEPIEFEDKPPYLPKEEKPTESKPKPKKKYKYVDAKDTDKYEEYRREAYSQVDYDAEAEYAEEYGTDVMTFQAHYLDLKNEGFGWEKDKLDGNSEGQTAMDATIAHFKNAQKEAPKPKVEAPKAKEETTESTPAKELRDHSTYRKLLKEAKKSPTYAEAVIAAIENLPGSVGIDVSPAEASAMFKADMKADTSRSAPIVELAPKPRLREIARYKSQEYGPGGIEAPLDHGALDAEGNPRYDSEHPILHNRDDLTPNDGQSKALTDIVKKIIEGGGRQYVIAGYAGTGKSSIVESIVRYFDRVDTISDLAEDGYVSPRKFIWTGPMHNVLNIGRTKLRNGKLDEDTEIDLTTITTHSGLLERDRKHIQGPADFIGHGDKANKVMAGAVEAGLKGGKPPVIIMDETGMVDDEMIMGAISAQEAGAIVIFLGDPGQLGPVEAGEPNPKVRKGRKKGSRRSGVGREIINPLKTPDITLTEIMRSDKGNDLLEYVTALRSMPKSDRIMAFPTKDMQNVKVYSVLNKAAEKFVEFIKTAADSVMWLSHTNKDRDKANQQARAALLGGGTDVSALHLPLSDGERLMVLNNAAGEKLSESPDDYSGLLRDVFSNGSLIKVTDVKEVYVSRGPNGNVLPGFGTLIKREYANGVKNYPVQHVHASFYQVTATLLSDGEIVSKKMNLVLLPQNSEHLQLIRRLNKGKGALKKTALTSPMASEWELDRKAHKIHAGYSREGWDATYGAIPSKENPGTYDDIKSMEGNPDLDAFFVEEKDGEGRPTGKVILNDQVLMATFGYASTIHKSQGQEFENVFVTPPRPVPYSKESKFFQPDEYFQNYFHKQLNDIWRLAYTASTRGQKTLHLIPPPEHTFFDHIIQDGKEVKTPGVFWHQTETGERVPVMFKWTPEQIKARAKAASSKAEHDKSSKFKDTQSHQPGFIASKTAPRPSTLSAPLVEGPFGRNRESDEKPTFADKTKFLLDLHEIAGVQKPGDPGHAFDAMLKRAGEYLWKRAEEGTFMLYNPEQNQMHVYSDGQISFAREAVDSSFEKGSDLPEITYFKELISKEKKRLKGIKEGGAKSKRGSKEYTARERVAKNIEKYEAALEKYKTPEYLFGKSFRSLMAAMLDPEFSHQQLPDFSGSAAQQEIVSSLPGFSNFEDSNLQREDLRTHIKAELRDRRGILRKQKAIQSALLDLRTRLRTRQIGVDSEDIYNELVASGVINASTSGVDVGHIVAQLEDGQLSTDTSGVSVAEGINISSYEEGLGEQLTNFAKIPVTFRGVRYVSSEAAYQASKPTEELSEQAFNASVLALMVEVITAKLEQHPNLTEEIRSLGGLEFLKKSTHNLIRKDGTHIKKNDKWTGQDGLFMQALRSAYARQPGSEVTQVANPEEFRLFSGGAVGADDYMGAVAKAYGIDVTHYLADEKELQEESSVSGTRVYRPTSDVIPGGGLNAIYGIATNFFDGLYGKNRNWDPSPKAEALKKRNFLQVFPQGSRPVNKMVEEKDADGNPTGNIAPEIVEEKDADGNPTGNMVTVPVPHRIIAVVPKMLDVNSSLKDWINTQWDNPHQADKVVDLDQFPVGGTAYAVFYALNAYYDKTTFRRTDPVDVNLFDESAGEWWNFNYETAKFEASARPLIERGVVTAVIGTRGESVKTAEGFDHRFEIASKLAIESVFADSFPAESAELYANQKTLVAYKDGELQVVTSEGAQPLESQIQKLSQALDRLGQVPYVHFSPEIEEYLQAAAGGNRIVDWEGSVPYVSSKDRQLALKNFEDRYSLNGLTVGRGLPASVFGKNWAQIVRETQSSLGLWNGEEPNILQILAGNKTLPWELLKSFDKDLKKAQNSVALYGGKISGLDDAINPKTGGKYSKSAKRGMSVQHESKLSAFKLAVAAIESNKLLVEEVIKNFENPNKPGELDVGTLKRHLQDNNFAQNAYANILTKAYGAFTSGRDKKSIGGILGQEVQTELPTRQFKRTSKRDAAIQYAEEAWIRIKELAGHTGIVHDRDFEFEEKEGFNPSTDASIDPDTDTGGLAGRGRTFTKEEAQKEVAERNKYENLTAIGEAGDTTLSPAQFDKIFNHELINFGRFYEMVNISEDRMVEEKNADGVPTGKMVPDPRFRGKEGEDRYQVREAFKVWDHGPSTNEINDIYEHWKGLEGADRVKALEQIFHLKSAVKGMTLEFNVREKLENEPGAFTRKGLEKEAKKIAKFEKMLSKEIQEKWGELNKLRSKLINAESVLKSANVRKSGTSRALDADSPTVKNLKSNVEGLKTQVAALEKVLEPRKPWELARDGKGGFAKLSKEEVARLKKAYDSERMEGKSAVQELKGDEALVKSSYELNPAIRDAYFEGAANRMRQKEDKDRAAAFIELWAIIEESVPSRYMEDNVFDMELARHAFRVWGEDGVKSLLRGALSGSKLYEFQEAFNEARRRRLNLPWAGLPTEESEKRALAELDTRKSKKEIKAETEQTLASLAQAVDEMRIAGHLNEVYFEEIGLSPRAPDPVLDHRYYLNNLGNEDIKTKVGWDQGKASQAIDRYNKATVALAKMLAGEQERLVSAGAQRSQDFEDFQKSSKQWEDDQLAAHQLGIPFDTPRPTREIEKTEDSLESPELAAARDEYWAAEQAISGITEDEGFFITPRMLMMTIWNSSEGVAKQVNPDHAKDAKGNYKPHFEGEGLHAFTVSGDDTATDKAASSFFGRDAFAQPPTLDSDDFQGVYTANLVGKKWMSDHPGTTPEFVMEHFESVVLPQGHNEIVLFVKKYGDFKALLQLWKDIDDTRGAARRRLASLTANTKIMNDGGHTRRVSMANLPGEMLYEMYKKLYAKASPAERSTLNFFLIDPKLRRKEAMNFTMRKKDNVHGKDVKTSELMEQGLRTSTTRSYSLGSPLDVITIEGTSGAWVVVSSKKITEQEYNDTDFQQEWSKLEGWTVDWMQNRKNIKPGDFQTVVRRIKPGEMFRAKGEDAAWKAQKKAENAARLVEPPLSKQAIKKAGEDAADAVTEKIRNGSLVEVRDGNWSMEKLQVAILHLYNQSEPEGLKEIGEVDYRGVDDSTRLDTMPDEVKDAVFSSDVIKEEMPPGSEQVDTQEGTEEHNVGGYSELSAPLSEQVAQTKGLWDKFLAWLSSPFDLDRIGEKFLKNRDWRDNKIGQVIHLATQKIVNSYYELDELSDLLTRDIERSGVGLTQNQKDGMNVAQKLRLYYGKTGKELDDAKATYEARFNELFTSLNSENPLKLVGEYWYARYAGTRNQNIQKLLTRSGMPLRNDKGVDYGSGMTDAEAQAIIARVEARSDFDKIQTLTSLFKDLNMATLENLVEGEVLPEDELQAIVRNAVRYNEKTKETEWVWAPLRGFEKDYSVSYPTGLDGIRDAAGYEAMQGEGTGSGFTQKPDSTYTLTGAFGRTTKADSHAILGNALRSHAESIVRKNKNKGVAQAMLNMLAEVADNPELYGKWQHLFKVHNPEDADFKKFWPSKKVPYKTMTSEGVEVSMVKEIQYNPLEDDKNFFVVRVKGKPIYIEFKGVVGERLVSALKNRGIQAPAAIMQHWSVMTSFFAAIYTVYNIGFMLTNFMRDVVSASLNLSGDPDTREINRKLFNLQSLGTNIKAMMAVAAARSNNNPSESLLKDRNLFEKVLGDYSKGVIFVDMSELETLMSDPIATALLMQKAGGQVEFFGLEDVEKKTQRLIKDIQKAQETNHPIGHKNGIFKLFEYIKDINTGVENSVRMEAFKLMLLDGKSLDMAAMKGGRESTVDFNRGGDFKSTLNALYPFFGAGVSANSRLLRSLFKDRDAGAGWKLAMKIITAGFMYNMLMRMWAGEDDETEEKHYDRLSGWSKRHQLNIFPKPGGDGAHFALPLPYGWNLPWGVGADMADMAASGTGMSDRDFNPASVAAGTLGSVIDTFHPMSGGDGLMRLIPHAPRVGFELLFNENFLGNPIIPENSPWSETPRSQRYWKNTSPLSIKLAEVVNSATGGDEFESGALDFSPGQLDHVLGYFGGTFGKQMWGLAGEGYRYATTGRANDRLLWKSTPLASTLWKPETNDYGTQKGFMNVEAQVAVNKKRIRKLTERGDRTEALAAQKKGAKLTAIDKLIAAHNSRKQFMARKIANLRRQKVDEGKIQRLEERLDKEKINGMAEIVRKARKLGISVNEYD